MKRQLSVSKIQYSTFARMRARERSRTRVCGPVSPLVESLMNLLIHASTHTHTCFTLRREARSGWDAGLPGGLAR